LSGVDELVISLAAKELTTGEIAAHFAGVYCARVSRDRTRNLQGLYLERGRRLGRNRPRADPSALRPHVLATEVACPRDVSSCVRHVASVTAVADPVSWLQIAQGWNVVTSDGVSVGVVAQVEGDKQSDVFDGLAVEAKLPAQILYVPGEQVGAIYPGEVTLKIASADTGTLKPFQAPPPETKWVPGKAPLATRMSNWLRGKR
jgi:hypothetical protein